VVKLLTFRLNPNLYKEMHMFKYCVEESGNHAVVKFYNKKEAMAYAYHMANKFPTIVFTVYPVEPN
jgi:hypothetical protein